MESKKQILKEAMNALFNDFDSEKVKTLFRKDYIQHNPNVPTGLVPILGLQPILEEAGFAYETHRVIEDGDILVTHSTATNAEAFGSQTVIAFDMWRIKDGKIAEHWDAIIPKFEKTASGRSQTDGATEIVDLDKTAKNKKLAVDFITEVLDGKDFSKADNYIRNGRYEQHNPFVEDGIEALQKVVGEVNLKNFKIHRVIGEGNFVLIQSEGVWAGKPMAIYDLFRIEDNYIVEHWDVLQEIPEKMAHDNTMF